MKDVFEGKVILVTGGCGSIGSEIVRQLLQYNPKVIRVYDTHENGHFTLGQELQSPLVRYIIGDIRDNHHLDRAMKGVNIIFHAAALKHVPLCEYNPGQAVSVNIVGTQNLVDAAIRHEVDKFIGISTDKAVEPVNTMGATKLLSEKIITNAPVGDKIIKFCCVRFGNVLASSGSIIPIFKEQIQKGNEVTITHPDMTRFFMNMPDAVSLVLKAATLVEGGEIFILKMSALKITDLAEVMIEELAPRHNKDPRSFTKRIIGVRPGEKLSEALLAPEEALYTEELDDMIVIRNSLLAKRRGIDWQEYKKYPQLTLHSKNMPLLSKEEIREILLEDKSILGL